MRKIVGTCELDKISFLPRLKIICENEDKSIIELLYADIFGGDCVVGNLKPGKAGDIQFINALLLHKNLPILTLEESEYLK